MTLQIASASVLGRDHVGPGKNNQDAVWVQRDGDTVVAVVCDGCGSGAHSEVGAKIGARLVAESIRRHLPWVCARAGNLEADLQRVLERVRLDVLSQIRVLANGMVGTTCGNLAEVVQDYFLFTVVGSIVGSDLVVTFSIGDGVVFRDGDRIDIGGKSDSNAPQYMAYALVETKGDLIEPRFALHGVQQAAEFSSLLIGTDGVEALLGAAGTRMPGRQELVGPVEQLWTDDRFFQNKDALRRYLALANRDHQQVDWKGQVINREHGHLKDDTSLVVIRRAP